MSRLTPSSATHDTPPAGALDPAQRRAVEHRGGLLRVLGAPGTGKTTVAVHTVLDRVTREGIAADRCLLLAPTRVAAADLRERISAGAGDTTREPLARTPQSFAFGLLRAHALRTGAPAPRLISGPEQDVVLRDLLAGHAAGAAEPPAWPDELVPALSTRGFREELRDLLMRAVELGLDPVDLAELAASEGEPAWRAAAQVLEEYDEVTALSSPGASDPAWIVGSAAELLRGDPDELHLVRSGLDLVVVDDAQELTNAAARLLRVLVGPGTDLVLVGDPDATIGTFRGADPRVLADPSRHFGPGATVVLERGHRTPPGLAEAAGRVADHIGALAGVAHRRPTPADAAPGRVETAVLDGPSQEAAHVAAHLRRAHLLDGVPWSQMAVIVRGSARTGALRRVLDTAGVPVGVPGARLPLREEAAVRPFLDLLRVVVGPGAGDASASPPSSPSAASAADVEAVLDLLTSPLGGADAMTVRRMRRALRRHELAAGGGRGSDELLVAAVRGEDGLLQAGPAVAPAVRLARVVAAGREAAARDDDGRWRPGVTPESVLWAMWDASGLAGPWRRTALRGGAAGARADRDLDAVVALFDAAARYVDRLPLRGPDGFLEHVLGQDVAGDSLVARAPDGDRVTLTTPAGVAGRGFDLVVVAGLCEGVWPDTRLRGSILGSERLVDAVTGRGRTPSAAAAAVRHDEMRLFHVAVTRARSRLLLTGVRDEDDQPSPYLDVVDPLPSGAREDRPRTPVPEPMSMPGLVARLRRRAAVGTDPAVREHAARRLAQLARLGVDGADPDSWWALRGPSDTRPLRSEAAPVTVSPSRLERFGQCGLRWLLASCGGESAHPAAASAAGTLVHDIAATVDGGEDELLTALDARRGELGDETGWLGRRRYDLARTMLMRLARYDRESREAGWTVVARELDARVEVGRALLRGRVDRLERDTSGALRVVDLKTGSHRPTKAELERLPQLGAYQVAIERGAFDALGSTSAGAALLQLGAAAGARTTLQGQAPLERADDPEWAETLVSESARGMGGAAFTATAGPWCRTCPSRVCCPLHDEGRQL